MLLEFRFFGAAAERRVDSRFVERFCLSDGLARFSEFRIVEDDWGWLLKIHLWMSVRRLYERGVRGRVGGEALCLGFFRHSRLSDLLREEVGGSLGEPMALLGGEVKGLGCWIVGGERWTRMDRDSVRDSQEREENAIYV